LHTTIPVTKGQTQGSCFAISHVTPHHLSSKRNRNKYIFLQIKQTKANTKVRKTCTLVGNIKL